MIPRPRFLFVSLVLLFIVISTSKNVAAQAVATYHNDPARTGANLNETALTPANVNSSQFGKLGSYPVDGQIYGQPLYMPNLTINGGQHNVVFAVTQHNSVYAFDADLKATSPLWMVNLGPSVPSVDGLGISPELGITSTPVIDSASNTIYVFAITQENGATVYRLHALDILTGNERPNSPRVVDASFPGSGTDSVNGTIALEHDCYQRAGIALANGQIYLSFGHCKHGWVLAYDKTSLQQTAVLNTTPDGEGGTIWMGGGAPAVDQSGNLYLITGTNIGSFGLQYNNSFLKLGSDLSVGDYFYPSNNQTLINNDADLGAGAAIVMPDNSSGTPHELIGGGKDGRIFVLNRDNMGQFDESQLVQPPIQTGTSQYNNIHSTPGYWNGRLYIHSNADVLRAYNWANGTLSTSSVDAGNLVYRAHGATVSISANGNSNGIVWDLDATNQPNGPVVLHAYDAANLSNELYNSTQAGTRDTAGPAVKFTVPTITHGKVYVGTGTELDVFGLLNTPPFGWIDGAVNASDRTTTIPQNGTLAASGWAADQEDGSPVARVEVRIDGTTVGTATLGVSRPDVANALGDARYTNSGWRLTYNIGTLVVGTHTVTAVAFDSAGVSTALRGSKAITVSAATNTPPFGWIDGAVNASDRTTTIPQNGTLAASGWAADQEDGSPVARVEVRIDGTTVGTAALGRSRPDVASAYNDPRYTNSGWSFSYNIGTLAAGMHTVTAAAFDSSGASSTLQGSKTITVTSTTAPTVQLTTNPSTITAGQSSTLSWSSSNATSVTISGVGTFGPSGTTTVAPSSTTTYTATATGSGGSATASATVTVQPSQTCTPAPNSVTVCSPTAGSTVSSPVTFVAAANAGSGIDAMAIYVDDQLAYGPVNSSSINTSLNIASGSHNIVVQAWVTAATETVIKKSLTITVTQ